MIVAFEHCVELAKADEAFLDDSVAVVCLLAHIRTTSTPRDVLENASSAQCRDTPAGRSTSLRCSPAAKPRERLRPGPAGVASLPCDVRVRGSRPPASSARSGLACRGYDRLSRARRTVRPPPRPLRVLDPRRGVPHPGARRAGGRARHAGRRAHRPRLARRRGRALPRGRQAGRQAAARLRGLRRGRPARPAEGLRAPHAPRRDERGLRQPDQALLGRLPRGLLLQAARRLGAARAPRGRARRALRLPLRPRLQGARGEPAERRRGRARPARADLRPRRRLRRDAERGPRRSRRASTRCSPAGRAARAAARRDRRRPLPARTRTRAHTRRCSASSRATR